MKQKNNLSLELLSQNQNIGDDHHKVIYAFVISKHSYIYGYKAKLRDMILFLMLYLCSSVM